MLKLIVVLAIVTIAAAQVKNFNGYKVFRVTPNSEEQTVLLHNLTEFSDEYDFWYGPASSNSPADLMVAPGTINDFEKIMRATGTPYSALIENVQTFINMENPPINIRRGNVSFDWTRYHILEEIYGFLDNVASVHPDKVQVVIAGRSYEGRQIKGIRLSFAENNSAIFIEGGMHSREWISTATATYLINELLNSQDPDVRALAESNDWYIFPSVNPDGYVYTHTHDRLWRKTRKPYGTICYGSDPNRNWGYKWMQGGASNYCCAMSYAGPVPFSEVETKSLSDFITSISGNLYAYISFHGYGQFLLFPYGHTTEHLDNYDELHAIATKAIKALSKRYGTQYVIGNVAEVIYVATGGSIDWVKNTFKIPLTYVYELRDKGTYGFILPPNQIIPTGQEVLDSLVALFKEANARGIPTRQ